MRESNILKGVVAGAIGGLVASWTMNQFQKVWAAAEEKIAGGKPKKSGGDGDDSTMKTADAIYKAVKGKHLTKAQKKKAGPAVHYAFGAIMGAVYGAATEIAPSANALAGIPFGATLFAGADEITLPLLGLSKGPAEYPLSQHVYGLVSHGVYGVTTEMVRKVVRG